MIKRKAMKLVKVLRSGEYKQGKGRLVDNEDEFCCLGVACNISKQDLDWEPMRDIVEHITGWHMNGHTAILPRKIMKEYGFYDSEGMRRDGWDININGCNYLSLADANDSGCTFNQIADYIENNWEQL